MDGEPHPPRQGPGLENCVQSCWAVVGGDGGIGHVERGQGVLASCPCLCLCLEAAERWLKLRDRPVPLPMQKVEEVDAAEEEDP